MLHFGTTELIIILIIVILLFGVGRIGKIASELGKGVRDFRSGLTGKEEGEAKQDAEAKTKTEQKADKE